VLLRYPDTEELAKVRAARPRTADVLSASQILSPQELRAARDRVALENETRVYDACRALVLDIDKSIADPRRAQACTNVIGLIDSERDRRRQAAQQAEQHRMAVSEQSRRDEELQVARDEQRRRSVAETLLLMRAMQPPPALIAPSPPPVNTDFLAPMRRTETKCRPDGIGGVDCESRQRP